MRRCLLAWIILSALPSSAFATWSIVAVDRSTGRVVIASATCVNQNDDFLKGVQAVVVPGKGVAACQASLDATHQNQMLVFQELQKTDAEDAEVAGRASSARSACSAPDSGPRSAVSDSIHHTHAILQH